MVWGITYRISKQNEAAVRQNLVVRETGYSIVKSVFYPSDPDIAPFELELFMATEKASTYLGPASNSEIAWQIYHAKVRFPRLISFADFYNRCRLTKLIGGPDSDF